MQLPVVFNDRYQLFRKIGEGGLAEVFQAQDMSLGRMVAVKVLREQFTRDATFLVNFHREAQSAAKLNNAYIVAVYDFGQYSNRPYIVMEWIPGSDLRTRINDQGALPVEQAIEYTIQICSAVGTAHRAGLVHGDLKPGNILITTGNQVKVTDFGLARALGESSMDEDEVVWGTPAYFAPEQASGDMVLPATDVYAIGIIMYEMVTGRVPFVGIDDQDVARKQLYEAHIPVDQLDPRIPEPLARIIDAAMAKSPNERFLTADHLREALILYKQGSLTLTSQQAPISAVVGSPVQGRRSAAPPKPRPKPQPAQTGGGFDFVMLFLGLVAIVAVLGLVPLFVAVYDAYANPASASTGRVQMPDVVGLEEPQAQAALQRLGLQMTVQGEAPHPTFPAFTIISQSVPAGAAVERGTAVSVVVSQGPPLVDVPNVVGKQFDEAEQILKSLDVVPQKYEDWSVEPPGQVISQEPPPGSVVANRSLVTLVVSSGSRTPVGANFGGEILLSAYEIPRLQFQPGEPIRLVFFWQPLAVPAADYNLFIQLTTPQGGIVSEIDTQPQGGPRLTSNWQIGEVIVDPYQLEVPPTTSPDNYQIRVGFYNPQTNTRVPILEPGRAEKDNLGGLMIRTIQVIQ
ncbi:MAG: Serine/threonine-protein kinase PknD [Anaerolineae bacterium]|nr:Serine/threonine-protein kinase PknD [Anaerolineae bacterium]